MERAVPEIGDPLVNHGYDTRICRFDGDYGTVLNDGTCVCISEFEKGADGVWRRPEEAGLAGAPDLERPVGENAPNELSEAAEHLHQRPELFAKDRVAALLLADVFQKWARTGTYALEHVNRVGGPETVRLARHINKIWADNGLTGK